MLYAEENKEGKIYIDKAVIGKIIIDVINRFKGNVVISNHKGKKSGFVTKIGVMDDVDFMDIHNGENGVKIKIYVLVKFGTSIKKVSEQLILNIKEEILQMTGLQTDSISIVISGTISKQTVKRHIEIKG